MYCNIAQHVAELDRRLIRMLKVLIQVTSIAPTGSSHIFLPKRRGLLPLPNHVDYWRHPVQGNIEMAIVLIMVAVKDEMVTLEIY